MNYITVAQKGKKKLKRIKALKDIYINGELVAKENELGALIENESNLSQTDAWATKNVIILNNSKVTNNSLITGNSIVKGNAVIENSKICDCTIKDKAIIENSEAEKSLIKGDTKIKNAKIFKNSEISGKSTIVNVSIPGNVTIKNGNIQNEQEGFCFSPDYKEITKVLFYLYKNINGEISCSEMTPGGTSRTMGSISKNLRNALLKKAKDNKNKVQQEIAEFLSLHQEEVKKTIKEGTEQLILHIAEDFPKILKSLYNNYDILYEAQKILLFNGFLNDVDNSLTQQFLNISRVNLKTKEIMSVDTFCCVSESLLFYIGDKFFFVDKDDVEKSFKCFKALKGNVLEINNSKGYSLS